MTYLHSAPFIIALMQLNILFRIIHPKNFIILYQFIFDTNVSSLYYC